MEVEGVRFQSVAMQARAMPLDMFPTGLLDGVVIDKTWSPHMPAELGGGSVGSGPARSRLC